jgi:hypothetical protein
MENPYQWHLYAVQEIEANGNGAFTLHRPYKDENPFVVFVEADAQNKADDLNAKKAAGDPTWRVVELVVAK